MWGWEGLENFKEVSMHDRLIITLLYDTELRTRKIVHRAAEQARILRTFEEFLKRRCHFVTHATGK